MSDYHRFFSCLGPSTLLILKVHLTNSFHVIITCLWILATGYFLESSGILLISLIYKVIHYTLSVFLSRLLTIYSNQYILLHTNLCHDKACVNYILEIYVAIQKWLVKLIHYYVWVSHMNSTFLQICSLHHYIYWYNTSPLISAGCKCIKLLTWVIIFWIFF